MQDEAVDATFRGATGCPPMLEEWQRFLKHLERQEEQVERLGPRERKTAPPTRRSVARRQASSRSIPAPNTESPSEKAGLKKGRCYSVLVSEKCRGGKVSAVRRDKPACCRG
jgi:hypothetical protein